MRAGVVQGVALAVPELGGLLVVVLAVVGLRWWLARRADAGWPRRTRLGGQAAPAAGPGVRPGSALAAAAGAVLVAAAVAVGRPGDAGPGTYALITVLTLGWLGAAAVCVAVSTSRARTARHRALRAASTPLHRRGRAVDHLIIPEAYR